ncbi:MAG: AAA family ATPase [Bradyrhizobium sp.]|nr:AAA family ATPase [Bradyrhizobium sp.]
MTSSETDDSQARVFAFLTNPEQHPCTHRIDTHAASVFLEGARALKIKRAVRFPFLDYSSLAKRKAACEDEIRINRPFAPEIYRRVVPITRAENGSLSLDGDGTPVEYAIEMTRFDERQTIDHLAEAGPLDPGLVDAIADAVAASHAIAPPADGQAWTASIPRLIQGNSSALHAFGSSFGGFAPAAIDDLDNASQAAFARVRNLLDIRGRSGFVRRCHGDLHLANIVLIDGKPVLFDAIEFDETIATVDVLYDLAFPLTDFLRYGRPEAANWLLNRYLAIAAPENMQALTTLPLLMSIRAAIRAHVVLARLKRDGSASDKAAMTATSRRYFDLACTLIHPPAPILIAVGGLSGTGKSVLARGIAPLVAPLPGAVILRSDVLRKQLFGLGETEKLPANAYEPEINVGIYEAMVDRAREMLSQGHSVVVDAVYAKEEERNAIREAARKAGVGFAGFFLVADLATRQERIAGRGADASDATTEIAATQESYRIGTVDWTIVDAKGTPDTLVKRCQAEIAGVPLAL